jgi:hypothetical protein
LRAGKGPDIIQAFFVSKIIEINHFDLVNVAFHGIFFLDV